MVYRCQRMSCSILDQGMCDCPKMVFSNLSNKTHGMKLTQPPPFVDVQFSDPTQKSAEPESIKIEKLRGGLPIWIVARYEVSTDLRERGVSFGLNVLLETLTRYPNPRSYWQSVA